MAIHALWEDRYGLSVRKGPIDLANLATAQADIASHDNDGNPTATWGAAHFVAVDPASAAAGTVMGQRKGTTTDIIFGIPVIGNPDFSTGQDQIEVQKTDGFATQRVGAAGEASDIFRAGQSPSTSFDFVATGKSLTSAGSVFFQNGTKELTGTLQKKKLVFPSAADGSDPTYYGTFLRKISASESNSRILSDGVGTSFALRASQTEPLTCSLGMNGRILVTDFDIDGDSAMTEAVGFGLDGKKNYLLQDCVVSVRTAADQNDVLAVESFDVNCSAEVSPNRFNTFFPLNLVLGNYTADGSFTAPMLGKGTNTLTANSFQTHMADAGNTSSTQSTTYTPLLITFSWVTAISAAYSASGTRMTDAQLTEPAAAQDLQIRVNAIITDVSIGGDTEATTTISFRGMNQFTAGTDTIIADAIEILYYDDQAASWGFNPYT